MGTKNSTSGQNNYIFSENVVDINALSDLYIACFEDEIDSARNVLKNSQFENVNRRELNGSTALHAAVECGHVEMVRLLLHEYGVIRHIADSNGRTAFELTQTDEMRLLFQRPTLDKNRFCGDESLGIIFSLDHKNNQKPPSRQVRPYENFGEVRQRHSAQIYWTFYDYQNDPLHRFIFKKWLKQAEDENLNHLLSIVDQYIGPSNIQYAKAEELVENFSRTRKSEPLIRLFTLETPFYRFINEGKDCKTAFYSLLNKSVKSIHDQGFEGICARGLSMTFQELEIYEWALQTENWHLEVRIFCSSTRQKDCVKFYAEANENNQRKQVMLIFQFPEICYTAIQLDKLSDGSPSISEFEDEQEVLILPETLFSVEEIIKTQSMTMIYLLHLNLCNMGRRQSSINLCFLLQKLILID